MTTADKADKVFQCGFAFRIWNKPVKDPNTEENLWDIRLFWMETLFYRDAEIENRCPEYGFKDIDDCLDDMLRYIEECEKNKREGKYICGNK